MLRIGQVAARSGVSVDTLRYYERLGLVPVEGGALRAAGKKEGLDSGGDSRDYTFACGIEP